MCMCASGATFSVVAVLHDGSGGVECICALVWTVRVVRTTQTSVLTSLPGATRWGTFVCLVARWIGQLSI